MLLYLALGFLLLGLLIGGAGMRRVGRMAGRTWRPGAGVLGVAAVLGAAVLAVRDAFAPAVGLLLVGIWLLMSARRTARPRHAPPPPAVPAMDLQSAASMLGVAPDASDAEVQAAYVRLMRRVHPDAGGAAGLAAQLNAARERMLKRPK